MKNATSPYKYSCRTCKIRQRCIDEKNLGPGIKRALVHRFASRTDTFETWDVLQQDCLLIREERLGLYRDYAGSGLLKRLQQTQEPPSEPSPVAPQPVAAERRPGAPAVQPSVQLAQELSYGLTILATQRMVRLPDEGEVVLGRFERGFSNPPDVDLAFDDGEIPSVSRRHALVMCRRGKQWIEDMGSINGTYVNGFKLALGDSVQLSDGDRILLGRCRVVHTLMPEWAVGPDPRTPHSALLVVTHTGQELELPDKDEIVVGRPDPALGYTPDVDLGAAGDISLYVSRRHIQIVTHGAHHFVQESGSSGGTRLNGRPIRMGDPPELLHPGDQLWLGGCVVAYEWRLLSGS